MNKILLKCDLCKYVNKVIPKYLIVLMNCIDKKHTHWRLINLDATIGDSDAQERRKYRKFTTTVPSINVKSITMSRKLTSKTI